jgi:hypothetical protein
MKTCTVCKKELDIISFKRRKRKRNGKITLYYESFCINCLKVKNKKYKDDHKVETSIYEKQRYENDSLRIKNNANLYYKNNKDHVLVVIKEYQLKNKDKINEDARIRKKKRKVEDPVYKMREAVSKSIYSSLKKNGSSKRGASCFKFLPYTVVQLKEYIEELFDKSWMTWENWGVYKVNKWNDNDPSTWVWNLDHIVPQSDLPFISMKEDNFKKCWALSNLRPYSAKQNILDGNRR